MNLYFYQTELGILKIEDNGDAITGISFEPDKKKIPDLQLKESKLAWEANRQLSEYLTKKRKNFQLPLHYEGTCFQHKVWTALLDIPFGETRSYKEIAIAIGNEKACRAVGGANHKNPIAIVIPCHRVIGADNSLTGYGGGLDMKQKLLELEKNSTITKYISF